VEQPLTLLIAEEEEEERWCRWQLGHAGFDSLSILDGCFEKAAFKNASYNPIRGAFEKLPVIRTSGQNDSF
jgi:hypothetical protein